MRFGMENTHKSDIHEKSECIIKSTYWLTFSNTIHINLSQSIYETPHRRPHDLTVSLCTSKGFPFVLWLAWEAILTQEVCHYNTLSRSYLIIELAAQIHIMDLYRKSFLIGATLCCYLGRFPGQQWVDICMLSMHILLLLGNSHTLDKGFLYEVQILWSVYNSTCSNWILNSYTILMIILDSICK